MNFLDPDLKAYLTEHTSSGSPLLTRLSRETYQKVLYPQMISSQEMGRFLSMISHMMRPRRILEIGTFTGFSCICMAEGLAEDGKIITLEINPEREKQILEYVQEAGYEDQVDLRIGDALELIEQVEDNLDLVFIDAHKGSYSDYFDLVWPKLRSGGILLGDNALWHGKVYQQEHMDSDTQAIRAFNDKVYNHPGLECILLPLKDGVMMVRKK